MAKGSMVVLWTQDGMVDKQGISVSLSPGQGIEVDLR